MILVTGGAGYVGRHVCRALGEDDVIVVDDLRNSCRAALPDRPIILREIERAKVEWPRIDVVLHCAGHDDCARSSRDPGLAWRSNVAATAAFFEGARGKPVVFSSSAAVYGEPSVFPVAEGHLKLPISPEGRSKWTAEQLLRDYGVTLTVLRLFTVAGDDEDHPHEPHLIPNVVRAALTGRPLKVLGDGSAVRDFVHVEDVARAHLLAQGVPGIFNVGSGRGWSVLEVLEVARRVTGRTIDVESAPARSGDPRALVADLSKARRELGWKPAFSLEEMIDSAWNWRTAHPDGYAGKKPEVHIPALRLEAWPPSVV